MSIIQSAFPFKFQNIKTHITDEQLNSKYADKGITFPDLMQAILLLKKLGFKLEIKRNSSQIWKKGEEKIYLTCLKDDVADENNPEILKRISKGVLITFAGNEPYYKI